MRNIDWDEPLSDDDRAWAADREELLPKIAENDARFAGGSDEDPPPPPPATVDDYDDWKVAELREEASKRVPAIEGVSSMKKEDVIAALRAWDADNPE